MQAKKEMAEFRSKTKQTGGGKPPNEVPLSGNDISAWLPNEFVIDTNEFDSDVNFEKVEDISYNNSDIIIEISNEADDKDKEKVMEVNKEVKQKITPFKKKVCNKRFAPDKNNMADEYIIKIAQDDLEHRKELHQLQIEAEKRRIRNLDMEFELIEAKINFFKKKTFDNSEI